MFFTYRQNNTGGEFRVNTELGIGEWVIVEADSAEEANEKSQTIGVYFHGCYYGQDCGCCGDRWSKIDEEEGTEEPKIYDESPEEYKKSMYGREKTVVVHYKNGETKVF